jgi:putative phosphoesterase
LITLGIIADTHIPDRMPRLHPDVLPVFKQAGVQAILHAGDVSVPRVLSELEQVAPVHAVRGNRDWVSLRGLPHSLELDFAGIKIGLAHGHGNLMRYVLEKPHNILWGVKEENYINYMLSVFPSADVIVFGHMHRVVTQRLDGKLMFDPGSACCPGDRQKGPSVGLLHLNGGLPEAEIVYLKSRSDRR